MSEVALLAKEDPITDTTGYILTSNSVDTRGKNRILLYEIGEEGPFEIVINGNRPVFFVDREAVFRDVPHAERKRVPMRSFDGSAVDALYFNRSRDMREASRTLRDGGVRVFESDIRPDDRYLMERFITRSVAISGEGVMSGGLTRYTDPAIRATDFRPRFRILSLDIETGKRGELYSIALHVTGGAAVTKEYKKVLMAELSSPTAAAAMEELVILAGERELLTAFLEEVRVMDPDIIIGWNVIGFDLRFLMDVYRKYGIPFALSRGGGTPVIIEKRTGFLSVELDGRLVIDGPQTLRAGFFTFEDYRLDTVAREVLGAGKDIAGEEGKVAEIERRFREDKAALARYNLKDCELVTDIFKKTGILNHLLTRSLITGMRMDKVSLSVATFDFFMLPRIHRKGFVAPDVADIVPSGQAPGGYVFTSEPGLYENVLVFDFRSLYPSIIRTFHIDPYSRLMASADPIDTPAGIKFSGSEHILPDFISGLLEKRAVAKTAGDAQLSQAIKILMNSIYGVMGTPGCRFYHPDLPTAITETGQSVLKDAAGVLQGRGYRVLYGDTDSIFVELKPGEAQGATDIAGDLKAAVNIYFDDKFRKTFGLPSYLEIEYEKHYEKFFLPAVRGGETGALKRYAGMIAGSGELEFTGLEFVRSDWTPLAKKFQYELFRRLFMGEELGGFIVSFVRYLKSGRYDNDLAYKRRLTKPAGEYTKNIPPHARAALILDPEGRKRIRSVKYVMTLRGPIPASLPHDDIDYAHYIDKQIKPLADGVLFVVKMSFDEIFEGKQLELF